MGFAVALVTAFPARAVDLESLISPGPLFGAHERDAKSCADCHARFDASSQRALCLVCHKKVAEDLAAATGFHGRIGDTDSLVCRTCHTEHKGADADILGMVPESFDHSATDFVLEGAHSTATCVSCHEADKLYREAPSTCNACHGGDDDPHKGRLGEECQDCHKPAAWEAIRFDHSTTRFALKGKHEDAACALCHPQQRFKDTGRECVSCHRVDDSHRGRLGTKCGECHNPRAWKETKFDHARETKFPLEGSHSDLACKNCHESHPKKVKLDMACVSCHKVDDDHHGRRGVECERCHDSKTWKRIHFDHDKDTRFALRGAHEKLACNLCHVGTLYAQKTPESCVSCHEGVDVHEGSAGDDCTQCHRESGWTPVENFDHDLTRFPILALHQLASCDDCHTSKRFTEAEETCAACHGGVDVHERTLGMACALCHNPNGWDRWRFDHSRQTDYALEGAHENLQCKACHVKPVEAAATTSRFGGYIELSSRCRNCHLSESPHDDAFGRDCERCHVDRSWKEIQRGLQ